MIRIVYFAWVREGLGIDAEALSASHPMRVGAVLDLLVARGGAYAATLSERGRLRFAVAQRIVEADAEVRPSEELAIFPPVTGG